MSSYASGFTTALANSVMHTLYDWPAWIGFAASEYLGQMVENQFIGQNMPLQYLARGITRTQGQEYFFHLKFQQQAEADMAARKGGM